MNTLLTVAALGIALLALILHFGARSRVDQQITQCANLITSCAKEIKSLREHHPVWQGQITALATILTHVINGMDEPARKEIADTFKTYLGNATSIPHRPEGYSEEDTKNFNNAFSMIVLAIVEDIK